MRRLIVVVTVFTGQERKEAGKEGGGMKGGRERVDNDEGSITCRLSSLGPRPA